MTRMVSKVRIAILLAILLGHLTLLAFLLISPKSLPRMSEKATSITLITVADAEQSAILPSTAAKSALPPPPHQAAAVGAHTPADAEPARPSGSPDTTVAFFSDAGDAQAIPPEAARGSCGCSHAAATAESDCPPCNDPAKALRRDPS